MVDNYIEALSACALYESKNAVNGPVIMRCIDAKVNDLLASEMPADLLHALGRTQALILYQITRFFDGDIVSRSSADAMFSDLQCSALALGAYLDWDMHSISDQTSLNQNEHDVSSLAYVQFSRQFWKQWILHESARRTFLISCFFMKVWKLLTGRQVAGCREDQPDVGRNWTLSAHLWQARDPFEFAAAWQNKKHYVVKRGNILSTLADACGDDVESFGKMLLTVSVTISFPSLEDPSLTPSKGFLGFVIRVSEENTDSHQSGGCRRGEGMAGPQRNPAVTTCQGLQYN